MSELASLSMLNLLFLCYLQRPLGTVNCCHLVVRDLAWLGKYVVIFWYLETLKLFLF